MTVAHMSHIVHTIKEFRSISAVQVATPAGKDVQRFAVEQSGVVSHKFPPLLQNCGSVSRLQLERIRQVKLAWAQPPNQEHTPKIIKRAVGLYVH